MRRDCEIMKILPRREGIGINARMDTKQAFAPRVAYQLRREGRRLVFGHLIGRSILIWENYVNQWDGREWSFFCVTCRGDLCTNEGAWSTKVSPAWQIRKFGLWNLTNVESLKVWRNGDVRGNSGVGMLDLMHPWTERRPFAACGQRVDVLGFTRSFWTFDMTINCYVRIVSKPLEQPSLRFFFRLDIREWLAMEWGSMQYLGLTGMVA